MEERTGNGQSTTPWITKCSKSEGPIVGSMRCAMFRNPPHSSLNNKGRLWIAFQDTRALASCVVPLLQVLHRHQTKIHPLSCR